MASWPWGSEVGVCGPRMENMGYGISRNLSIYSGTDYRLRIEYLQRLKPCGVIDAERHPPVLE
jgi:hypothetical protein